MLKIVEPQSEQRKKCKLSLINIRKNTNKILFRDCNHPCKTKNVHYFGKFNKTITIISTTEIMAKTLEGT